MKTEPELEREQSLVEQRFYLTEERHFVMVPAPGSGVPGAPADWEPPEGMEQHTPVLFLDLNADDFSTGKKKFHLDYFPDSYLHLPLLLSVKKPRKISPKAIFV